MGNKSDMPDKTITKHKGRELAQKYKFLAYREVSAKEGTYVSKVMDTVLSQVEKN